MKGNIIKGLVTFTWFLVITLIGCSKPNSASPNSLDTPDPIRAYVDANFSQGTAVAAIATANYFSNQLTATVESHNLQSTERAWSVQSTEHAANNTATARVWDATATAVSAQSTSTAAELATANAIHATETQHAFNITSTADYAVAQAFATQQFSRAKQAEMAIRRYELTNRVRAMVPWVMLIIVFFVVIEAGRNWARIRVIRRDQRGDAPLLLNVLDGVAYDADRHPTSIAGFQRNDIKRLPQFSAEAHTQATTRDQMIDLATRDLLSNAGSSHRKAVLQQISNHDLLTSGEAPRVEVIDPKQARPLFRDVVREIMQDSIEVDLISDEEGDMK